MTDTTAPLIPERLAEAIKRRLWMASPTLRRRATAAEVRDIAAGLVDLFTAQAAEVDQLRAQVAAVEALAKKWDEADRVGQHRWGALEPSADALRAALASGDDARQA